MNRRKRADISERLKHLRKVTAPAKFEVLLHQRIRGLHAKNRFVGWLLRPLPSALIVAGSALVIVVFFAYPFFSTPPTTVSGKAPVSVPTPDRATHLAGPGLSHESPRTADSLSADTPSIRRNDVNTSKLP